MPELLISKDKNWTPWYCDTSHKIVNGIQYSLRRCDGRFVEIMVYDWHQHITKYREIVFFERAFKKESIESRYYFWNCGKDVIEWAKHWVDYRCHEMELHQNNLSKCMCLEKMKGLNL